MRLFVALKIPPDVRENLASFLNELVVLTEQSTDKHVRWVRPEDLHVTLKFIPEVPTARLEGIQGALGKVHSNEPIDLRFRGLEFFRIQNRPVFLWMGLDASANLAKLAHDIDRSMNDLDLPRDSRSFVPYLTLARFTSVVLDEKFHAAIRKNSEREFGGFRACEFHLFERKLKPSGAEYPTLQSFSIISEA